MSFLDALRFRPVIGIHRELRRLNDTLDAVMLYLQIPTKAEALARIADAEREMAEAAKKPLDVELSPAQRAANDLRARAIAGERVDPEDVIAAARALDEEEEPESVW